MDLIKDIMFQITLKIISHLICKVIFKAINDNRRRADLKRFDPKIELYIFLTLSLGGCWFSDNHPSSKKAIDKGSTSVS